MLRAPIYPTRYIAPLIAAATTAVALAACGGSGHPSATAEVEHTIAAYVHDIPAELYGVAPGERLVIPAVAVRGTEATATVRLRSGNVKVPLTASNGHWLMAEDQPVR